MVKSRKNLGADDLTTLLGKNVRAHRLRLGMNQRAFAKLLGILQSQVSSIELGRHSFSAETLERLALALKTSPSNLLKNNGVKKSAPISTDGP